MERQHLDARQAASEELEAPTSSRKALSAAEEELVSWKDSNASPETRRSEIVRADAAVSEVRAALWKLDEPDPEGRH